jgi:hypothetical protein
VPKIVSFTRNSTAGERIDTEFGMRQASTIEQRRTGDKTKYAVVNHLHLTTPADQLGASTEQSGLAVLKQLPGFRGLNLVKVADEREIVILHWDTVADAQHGAATIGPTWFAPSIAPFLASEQQRSAGEVIVENRD